MVESRSSQVEATRRAALTHARSLLAARGMSGLTYTTLAEASGVSRQTLYRHWPTLHDLVNDLPSEQASMVRPHSAADVRAELVRFLCDLHASMDDPERAAVFAQLLSQADHDTTTEKILQRTTQYKTKNLNEALAPLGLTITEADLAFLAGPVFFRRFFYRQPLPRPAVETVVDSFLGHRRGGGNSTEPETDQRPN